MAKAPKPDPNTVTTGAQEAIMLAEMLHKAGVAPEKAAEIVNNAAHYATMDDIIRAAGLDPAQITLSPASRSAGDTVDAFAVPSKYLPFPNAVNAYNWYIANGYPAEMTELWIDDRINRGGLYKDSWTLITSWNPRALMKVPAARLATI
jgi:hypothetical protein